MNVRAKIDKLDARERRLLTLLGGVVGALLLLAGPVGIWSVLSSKRSDNQEIRDLIQQIHASSAQVSERRAKHDALLER